VTAAHGFQIDELQAPRLLTEVKPGNGNRQMKPAGPGASRIDEPHAVTLGLAGLMRVSADDYVKPRGARIQVQCLYVMKDVHTDCASFDSDRLGQDGRPRRRIDVAADSNNGCELLEGMQYIGGTDISGVNDEI
jgi:hypothetical protein